MNKHLVVVFSLCSMLVAGGVWASERASASHAAPVVQGSSCTLYSYMIEKIGPMRAEVGEDVTYHVFVSNLGDCFLHDINVREMLPEGLVLVSANPAPTVVHDGHLLWKDVALKPGRYIDFVVTAKVVHPDLDDAIVTNKACAFTPLIGQRICGAVSTTIERR
jgi:uncharacterized repeat protein (TIGR01451 family)